MLSARLFVLAGLLALAGCATSEVPPPRHVAVDLGAGVILDLPARPGFPRQEQLSQLITSRHNGQSFRVQAELTLGPDNVQASFAPPGGPPVLTVKWNAAGISAERSAGVPDALQAERILADIAIARWPGALLSRQLSSGATISDETGLRVIRASGRRIMTVTRNRRANRETMKIANLVQGYDLTIVTRLNRN